MNPDPAVTSEPREAQAVPGWPLRCPSCDHDNPEGSIYCNRCGMPVHFRWCGQCEAINHRAADHCHKCGNPLALPPEPPPKLEQDPVTDAGLPHGASTHRRSYVMRAGATVVMLVALAVPAYLAYEDPDQWRQGTVDVMGPPAPTLPSTPEVAASPIDPAADAASPPAPVDDAKSASSDTNAAPPAPAAKKARAPGKSGARKPATSKTPARGSREKAATPAR